MKHLYKLKAASSQKWLWACCIFCAMIQLANAQVSGLVFRDFDLNGIRSDTLPIEVGVAGITFRAFVDLRDTPLLTTTNTDGSYAFDAVAIPGTYTLTIPPALIHSQLLRPP